MLHYQLMHINLEINTGVKWNIAVMEFKLTNPIKNTSEAPAEAPAAGVLGWNDTTFPPKPKEAPTGRLYHFGALNDTA